MDKLNRPKWYWGSLMWVWACPYFHEELPMSNHKWVTGDKTFTQATIKGRNHLIFEHGRLLP